MSSRPPVPGSRRRRWTGAIRNLAAAWLAAALAAPAQADGPAGDCAPDRPDLRAYQRALAAEVNLARTDPRHYATLVDAFFAKLGADGVHRRGSARVRMREGRRAVDEAIRFLERVAPKPPLVLNECLSRAAQDHAEDLGSTGSIEHAGSDGRQPSERAAQRLGRPASCGENTSFGSETVQEDVIGLIVDDGVSSRGHRRNLFSDDFRSIGIGAGPHVRYRTVVVYLLCTEALPGS